MIKTTPKTSLGIRGRLLSLLFVVLIPILLIQTFIFYENFRRRKADELQANFEMARAVGKAFEAFVMDVLHSELAIVITATASPPLTPPDLVRLLEQCSKDYSGVRFHWVGPEGRILASSHSKAIGVDVSDRPFFRQMESGREWVVSDLTVSKMTGQPGITISRGIRDKSGMLLGLAFAGVDRDYLDSVLAVERSKGGAISLRDSKGVLFYRFPHIPESRKGRDQAEGARIFREALEGREVAERIPVDDDGKIRLVAATPIRSIGWIAGAGRSEKEAMRPAVAALIRNSGIFLCVAFLSFLAALAISRAIANPIRRTLSQLNAFRGGSGTEARFEVSGPAEIRELTKAFNSTLEALQRSEARLRRLYESGLVSVVYWNMDGAIVDANDKFLEMAGYTREELSAGKIDWIKITPPGYRHLDEQAVAELRTTGVNKKPYEKELIRRDGTRVPIIVAGAMLDGARFNGVAFVLDITDRKRMEDALRQSEAMLRAVLDQMPSGVTVRDARTGALIISNARSREIFGPLVDAPEQFGRYRGFHSDGRPYRSEEWPISRSMATGEVVVGEEILCKRNDSTRVTVSISSAPVRDSQGQIVIGVGVIDDITERKRAEEELRRSELRFRLLSEIAGRLLASDNPQGLVNDLCRRVMEHLDCHAFFNFLVDEKAGKLRLNACAGVPDEIAREIEWLDYGVAVCGCVAREGKRIIAEDILHTPDIRTELVKSFGIQAYACHPLMIQGKLIGTLSFGTKTRPRFSEDDISLMKTVADHVATAVERMRLIEELRHSRDGLELRVQERTSELARKNQELQEFAFVASHDMSEPLRKIQAFGTLLESRSVDRLNDEEKGFVSRMTGAANRMQELLDALLRYSRVETKGEDFRTISLNDIVQDVAGDLEIAIRDAEARLEIGPLPVLFGDPNQFRQLFQNLIANAVKYHRPEVKTLIRIYGEENGGTGRIFVEDNGIGFDERYLEKIFQPFQRLHGRSEYPGTGIGLAICKKIVERHGGTISARSTPGKGSTFIVEIPNAGCGSSSPGCHEGKTNSLEAVEHQ